MGLPAGIEVIDASDLNVKDNDNRDDNEERREVLLTYT